MQRIYGTAFFTQEELDAWLKQKEEAERRDHRRLGRRLTLQLQRCRRPWLVLWHPNAGLIRKQIEQFSMTSSIVAATASINTPHLTQSELFRISGHLGLIRRPLSADEG
jgi:threonyl-tRNA synthetase